MKIVIGKAGERHVGAYSPQTSYDVAQVVTDGYGNWWVSLKGDNIGHSLPSVFDGVGTRNEWWLCILDFKSVSDGVDAIRQSWTAWFTAAGEGWDAFLSSVTEGWGEAEIEAKKQAVTDAVDAANAAAGAAGRAAEGASSVNASISGTELTVTDRNGVSRTVDTKGEKGENLLWDTLDEDSRRLVIEEFTRQVAGTLVTASEEDVRAIVRDYGTAL